MISSSRKFVNSEKHVHDGCCDSFPAFFFLLFKMAGALVWEAGSGIVPLCLALAWH